MFSSDFIQQLLIAVPAILLALTFHEVAHAWVADKLGDNTARMLGRLNLNPIVHLDLMGTLAFVISMMAGVGFGWAKPVPVNPGNFRHPRRGMMWVALAGPATNFILAIISGFLFSLLRGSGLGYTFVGEPIMLMLRASFTINTALAAFNLIPHPPLRRGEDRHGAAAQKTGVAILAQRAVRILHRVGPVAAGRFPHDHDADFHRSGYGRAGFCVKSSQNLRFGVAGCLPACG